MGNIVGRLICDRRRLCWTNAASHHQISLWNVNQDNVRDCPQLGICLAIIQKPATIWHAGYTYHGATPEKSSNHREYAVRPVALVVLYVIAAAHALQLALFGFPFFYCFTACPGSFIPRIRPTSLTLCAWFSFLLFHLTPRRYQAFDFT